VVNNAPFATDKIIYTTAMIRYLIYALSLLICGGVAWADCNSSTDITVSETLKKPISKPYAKVGMVDANASKMIPQDVSQGAATSIEKTTPQAIQNPSVDSPATVNDCQGISMDELVQRLKESKAIGLFTKLAIRSDVLDFKQYVDDLKKKKTLDKDISKVRESFNGLVLKIMALLEEDPDLSEKIYTARSSIFKSLLEVKS